MIWPTLKAVRTSLFEFAPRLRAKHCIVKLRSGKYTRTLGAPQGCTPVRGNLWVQS